MDIPIMTNFLITLILSYLLGSFPSGYLAGKWILGIDLREIGAGSTGATNVSTSANLSITFSEAMDPDTITNNTSNTTCSGFTFQLSKADESDFGLTNDADSPK